MSRVILADEQLLILVCDSFCPSSGHMITFNVGLFAAVPTWTSLVAAEHIAVLLKLYAVHNNQKKYLTGTVQAVLKMGHECVEFYPTYHDISQPIGRARLSMADWHIFASRLGR